jgi:uncharacterized protein YqgC (DUF456 family)
VIWDAVLILALVLCVAVVPLGLPGTWVMVALLLAPVVAGTLGWIPWAATAGLAALGEAGEFWIVTRWLGGQVESRWPAWGALLGGLAGAVVGLPLPVVGSLAGLALGTVAGAFAAALLETRRLRPSARAAWKAALARAGASALKTVVAVLAAGVATVGLLGGF